MAKPVSRREWAQREYEDTKRFNEWSQRRREEELRRLFSRDPGGPTHVPNFKPQFYLDDYENDYEKRRFFREQITSWNDSTVSWSRGNITEAMRDRVPKGSERTETQDLPSALPDLRERRNFYYFNSKSFYGMGPKIDIDNRVFWTSARNHNQASKRLTRLDAMENPDLDIEYAHTEFVKIKGKSGRINPDVFSDFRIARFHEIGFMFDRFFKATTKAKDFVEYANAYRALLEEYEHRALGVSDEAHRKSMMEGNNVKHVRELHKEAVKEIQHLRAQLDENLMTLDRLALVRTNPAAPWPIANIEGRMQFWFNNSRVYRCSVDDLESWRRLGNHTGKIDLEDAAMEVLGKRKARRKRLSPLNKTDPRVNWSDWPSLLCVPVAGLHTVETLQADEESIDNYQLEGSDAPGVCVWVQRCAVCRKTLNVVTNARPGVLLTMGAPVFTEWHRGLSIELSYMEAVAILQWADHREPATITRGLPTIRNQLALFRDAQTRAMKEGDNTDFLAQWVSVL